MKRTLLLAAAFSIACGPALAQENPRRPNPPEPVENQRPDADGTASPDRGILFHPENVASDGSVAVEGQRIDYRAVAGTIIVHPKGWDDAAWRARAATPPGPGTQGQLGEEDKNPQAEASMFYVAYFRKGAPSASRPITFLYNGGPGSSTVWLHMGAFGPRRIVTSDHEHTPAAPYDVVDNAFSLLDASDLVFIDAPGTGFSRIAGKDKEKAFWGVDADAYAFSQFILGFLSKYGRWNSPKYLFGELRHAAFGGGGQPAPVERRRRFQRGHPALANPQFRHRRRWPGEQSRDRPGLCRRLADLRRDRLVP
jgi:hypothetical protein